MKHSLIAILTFFIIVITVFVYCDNPNDDGGYTNNSKRSYSLVGYSIEEGDVITDTTKTIDERLICGIDSNECFVIMHKNVVFDSFANIKVSVVFQGNNIIVTEYGNYGESGIYKLYIVKINVGALNNGDYTLIVKRNNNIRGVFPIKYKVN